MKIENLKKTYSDGKENITALKNVSYNFNDAGLVVITGKSGSGKSTLLYSIAGILSTDSGKIIDNDNVISEYSEYAWDDWRNRSVGFIFQDYKLLEENTVEENLDLVLDIQQDGNHADRIKSTLDFVGLSGFEKRKVSDMSGGQKQRVAIARAIVKKSKMILADEPTGNLDEKNSEQIWQLLKKVSADHLVIAVTHDKKTALNFADFVIEMSDGEISNCFERDQENCKKLVIENGKVKHIFTDINYRKLYDYLMLVSAGGKTNVEIYQEGNSIKKENAVTHSANIENIKIKRLSLGKCIAFAFTSIKRRLVRHLLTSFMFAIAIVFAIAALMLYNFSYGKCVANYISDTDTEVVELVKYSEYVNGLEEVIYQYLERGEYLCNCITQEIDEQYIVKVKKNISIGYGDGKYIEGVCEFYTNSLNTYEIDGKYPEKEDEILITDYIAYLLGNNGKIGENVTINGEKLNISGIITTDFKEYGLIEKLRMPNVDTYTSSRLDYMYLIVIRNTGVIDREYKPVSCKASDFSLFNRELGYLNSQRIFGSSDYAEKVLYGHEIENDDEILISNSMYQEIVGTDVEKTEDFQPFEAYFLNIGDSKYNNVYSDIINMYDIVGNSVTVVGVVQDDEYCTDIYLHPSKYEKLKKLNDAFYWYDSIYINTQCGRKLLADIIDKNDLYWNEPTSAEISNFASACNNLKSFITILFVALLIVAVLVLINCISFSIKDSARSIGIIRALGVRKNDTFRIYFAETSFILILSCILADALCCILIGYTNNFVNVGKTVGTYELFSANTIYFVLMNVFILVAGFIATFIPINKLSQQKVYDLLKVQ